jgi:hypothetical protein
MQSPRLTPKLHSKHTLVPSMDTAPYTDIGQFPRHDAFNPENSDIFDPNCNSTLDRIARRILPVAYPANTVSSLTDYTVGPNPMYTVTITGERHPVKLFCDSRDSMYVMVPLVDNPRVQALATMSNSARFLTEFLTFTEHFPHHTQDAFLSSGPPGTQSPYFRVLYRSTGTGPGAKHLIFSAFGRGHIMTFLEVYLDLTRGSLNSNFDRHLRFPEAFMAEHFPLLPPHD